MTEGQNPIDCRPLGQSERFASAPRLLLTAIKYARKTGVPVWDFAVEMRLFHGQERRNHDLRWPWARGFVEHPREATGVDNAHRKFRPQARRLSGERSCFVLTDRNISRAERSLNGATARAHPFTAEPADF